MKMKVVRINDKCDKIVTRLAKRIGSTKSAFVSIILMNITDEQITNIYRQHFYKSAKPVPTDIVSIKPEPEEIPYGEQICPDCGEKYINCDCNNVVDWDEENDIEIED